MSGILILIGIVTVLVLVCLSRRNSQSQTPRRLQAKQPRNSRTAKNAASRGSRNNAATNMNGNLWHVQFVEVYGQLSSDFYFIKLH